jgi:6-pyruvoyltetrahydropterin/6-carboxytetrahydropterin synthase
MPEDTRLLPSVHAIFLLSVFPLFLPFAMFELRVTGEFCAAHALSISGTRETLHGHNWRVAAVVAGKQLDKDGLLCDFHTVQSTLHDIIKAFDNQNLHDCIPFDRFQPTAENVARVIADELSSRLDAALLPHARVARVSVTEAPGCEATYLLP